MSFDFITICVRFEVLPIMTDVGRPTLTLHDGGLRVNSLV
jgi:hypothetical protein